MTYHDRKSLSSTQSSHMDFVILYFQLACTYSSIPADLCISIAAIKKPK